MPAVRRIVASTVLAVALAPVGLAACGGGSGAAPPAPPPAGRRLFVAQRCGDCHALADAHARGGAGPDLDTSERLDRAQVLRALVEGANGMPSYAGRLTRAQRERLAGYLLAVAWHHGA